MIPVSFFVAGAFCRDRGKVVNSFASDLKRAVGSVRFPLAVLIQLAALWVGGFASQAYRMTVPFVCTLPYACGWLEEYTGSFTRLMLIRSTRRGYILSKFFACGLAGGGAEALAGWVFTLCAGPEAACPLGRMFLSGFFWASAGALLTAAFSSRYLAWGGPFVAYYFLVILHERYWPALYCLYPPEWIDFTHTWMFGEAGLWLMLLGGVAAMALGYAALLERKMEDA